MDSLVLLGTAIIVLGLLVPGAWPAAAAAAGLLVVLSVLLFGAVTALLARQPAPAGP